MADTRDASSSTTDLKPGTVGSILEMFKGLGSNAFSLIQNNSISARNVVVAAATYGLERLLNAEVFNCPEKRHELYGYTFLFAPVIIMFCINALVIREVWMCKKCCKRCVDCCGRFFSSILKACVGPAVWLIVAFLEEDYFLCAKLGPVPGRGNATLTSEQEDVEWREKVEEYKGLSHILAWSVLVALVVVGIPLVTCCKKCCPKDNPPMDSE